MKFNVACFSYFGLFLAREMARLGRLGTLFTNLPVSWTEVPADHVRNRPWLTAPFYMADRFRLRSIREWLSYPTVTGFDRWVAASMTPCDIFHCFSSYGVEAHRAARSKYGAMTIVEHGSSHIAYQTDILREEHERWGAPFSVDQRLIDRELVEYAECDYITLQSSFAWRSFVEKGISPSKLIKLPLAVDLRMFRPVPKRDSVFRVLYAGSLSLRKGIPYLLEAIASLNLPNFEFVANGTISPDVAPIVRRYSDKVRFLGKRSFDQLYDLYSQASVFVLPTVEDGFAKVITEAMACGVPVIATTNCSAEDVLTNGVEGFIVPIRDPAAIREKILYLYEHPEIRDRMGQAALQRMRTEGGWPNYGERALAAYVSRREAQLAAANRVFAHV